MNKLKKIFFFDIEKAILNNITRISFYLIIILTTLEIAFKFIDIGYFITIVGAIFAFWYGYKKYEREKGLEEFRKFFKIINKIEESGNFSKIIKLRNEQFYLYYEKYISEELWKMMNIRFLGIIIREINSIGKGIIIKKNLNMEKEVKKMFKLKKIG